MFFTFCPTVTFYALPRLGVIPANQKGCHRTLSRRSYKHEEIYSRGRHDSAHVRHRLAANIGVSMALFDDNFLTVLRNGMVEPGERHGRRQPAGRGCAERRGQAA